MKPLSAWTALVALQLTAFSGCLGGGSESRPAGLNTSRLEIHGLDVYLSGRSADLLLKGADYASAPSSAYVQKPQRIINWPESNCGAILLMLNRQNGLLFVDWSDPDQLKYSSCIIIPWNIEINAAPEDPACLVVAEIDDYHAKDNAYPPNRGVLYVDAHELSWHDSMNAALAWENRDGRWGTPSSQMYQPSGEFSFRAVEWNGSSCRVVLTDGQTEQVLRLP